MAGRGKDVRAELSRLTVRELKPRLRAVGLKVGGRKAELVDRLVAEGDKEGSSKGRELRRGLCWTLFALVLVLLFCMLLVFRFGLGRAALPCVMLPGASFARTAGLQGVGASILVQELDAWLSSRRITPFRSPTVVVLAGPPGRGKSDVVRRLSQIPFVWKGWINENVSSEGWVGDKLVAEFRACPYSIVVLSRANALPPSVLSRFLVPWSEGVIGGVDCSHGLFFVVFDIPVDQLAAYGIVVTSDPPTVRHSAETEARLRSLVGDHWQSPALTARISSFYLYA